MFIHQDAAYQNAVQERLERLFQIDGRSNPEHPHHATFTGLAAKYNGISTTGNKDISA